MLNPALRKCMMVCIVRTKNYTYRPILLAKVLKSFNKLKSSGLHCAASKLLQWEFSKLYNHTPIGTGVVRDTRILKIKISRRHIIITHEFSMKRLGMFLNHTLNTYWHKTWCKVYIFSTWQYYKLAIVSVADQLIATHIRANTSYPKNNPSSTRMFSPFSVL